MARGVFHPTGRPGPYDPSTGSVRVDKRTREYRMLKQVRAELTAHVGGKPSAVQQRMIERTALLHVRLAMLDAKMLLTRTMTDAEMRSYIFWHNSYTRVMAALGVKAPRPKRDETGRSKLTDIIGRAA